LVGGWGREERRLGEGRGVEGEEEGMRESAEKKLREWPFGV